MRSTTLVVCAGDMPSGSFQHVFRCALNAALSSADRLAVTVDSESKPFSGAFGRLSSAGMLTGSKIEGVGCGVTPGDGVCGPSAACWLTCGGLGCNLDCT